MRTFPLVLTTLKACWRVKTWFKVGFRLGLGSCSGSGLGCLRKEKGNTSCPTKIELCVCVCV